MKIRYLPKILPAVVTVTAFALLVHITIHTATALAPPTPGAIFTTNSACTGVNLNIYDSKGDVYLDGGPAHPGAAGLDDGYYCVQVTEPNGTVLGKSSGAVVQVKDGEFVMCYKLDDWVYSASSGITSLGFDDTGNPGGEYKVWVSKDCNFPPSASKTDNFKVRANETSETAELCVKKFYDANTNGMNDDNQPIAGWQVVITDDVSLTRYTPICIILEPDNYTVTESNPVETNWVRTTANPVNVQLSEGDKKTVEFGNVCLGQGGGKTLGFWSNKNGYAAMNDGATVGPELALLSSLCLRNAGGADFNPTTYDAFRTWILGASATNMAYMLSAQLAAMVLNVEAGFVGGGSFVYAPGLIPFSPPGLNAAGFISVNNLIAAANTELCTHSTAVAGDPWRAYQEALKNVLDKANNNTNFVQATPCAFSFP